MLLIFGLTSRTKTLGRGRFHCPNEGVTRPYEHVEARRWFSLFFVPLIPLGTQGEWVRCEGCGVDLDPDVVARHPAAG